MQDEVEPAGERPGDPDGFQRLWTPHRMVYIGGQDKPKTATAADCPFCTLPKRSPARDRESLIVHRDEVAYVVLNLYPYSPGHLLVCPYRHVADYTDLTQEETHAVARLTQQCMRVVREASAPDGFNLGLNQGAVAGAGIAAHLHQHVVPRWAGDANFLPVVGQTKALPQLLDQTWEVVTDAWHRLADETPPEPVGGHAETPPEPVEGPPGTPPEPVEGPRSGRRPSEASQESQPLRGPSTSSGGVEGAGSGSAGGASSGSVDSGDVAGDTEVPVAPGGEV